MNREGDKKEPQALRVSQLLRWVEVLEKLGLAEGGMR